MRRQRVMVAVAGVVIAAGVAVLVQQLHAGTACSGDVSSTARQGHRDAADVLSGRGRRASPDRASVRAPRPGQLRGLHFVSRDRRDGELDVQYDSRLMLMDMHEQFVREADVTDDQNRRLMAAMAVVQRREQCERERMHALSQAALEDEIRRDVGATRHRRIAADFLAEAAEILDAHQFHLFETIGWMKASGFLYGGAQPIEPPLTTPCDELEQRYAD